MIQKEYAYHLKCLSKNDEDNNFFWDLKKKCKVVRNKRMVDFFLIKLPKILSAQKNFIIFNKR